jgi:hypothetical protein
VIVDYDYSVILYEPGLTPLMIVIVNPLQTLKTDTLQPKNLAHAE